MQHGGRDALVSAEIDCFVDLDPARKGVHMSRFPELFEEAIDELVIGEMLLVERLAEHRPPHRRAPGCAARRGEDRRPLPDRAHDPGDRAARRAGDAGWALRLRRARRRGGSSGSRRRGSTRAPARRGSSATRQPSGSARPVSRMPTSRASSSSSWLRTTSAAAALYLGTDLRLDAEDAVELVESSESSPVYELLKRPDELFVVEHARATALRRGLGAPDGQGRARGLRRPRGRTSSSPARSTSRRSTTTTSSPSASARSASCAASWQTAATPPATPSWATGSAPSSSVQVPAGYLD